MTPNAQELVARGQVGHILRVYAPHTLARLLGALLLTAGGVATALVAAAVTGSDLIPPADNPVHVSSQIHTSSTEAHYLPLAGAVLILFALVVLASAITQASCRIVIGDRGVVLVTRKTRDSFFYTQVSGVKRRTVRSSSTRAVYNGPSSAPSYQTTTSIRYKVTVSCVDGRTFLLDSAVFGTRVRRLGKDIERRAAAARANLRGR